MSQEFNEFAQKFKLLASKRKDLITNTLSNIFTMRIIGNKTHGDLAEVGITEFIQQFMDGYSSTHVGKDLFRAKEHEEDILVKNETTKAKIPISLKAYGVGPLQLSTDSDFTIFPFLQEKMQGEPDVNIEDNPDLINNIINGHVFKEFEKINVLPLIYNERSKQCNIMVFDSEKAKQELARIVYIDEEESFLRKKGKVVVSKGRSHPIYMFLDKDNNYIFEVRYGDASANALQRGLWTHTENAKKYFNSLTDGWINYSQNLTLVKLFRLALNATEKGHELANKILQKDIDELNNVS